MKMVVLILVIMSTLMACSEDKFVGSDDTMSEIRNVDYLNEVSSEGTFEVTIIKGEEQSIEIVANSNIIHLVKTDVVVALRKNKTV